MNFNHGKTRHHSGHFIAPLLGIFGILVCIFTQFSDILWVPGLHFDEAWQGLYAHRIAFEPGFWPLQAMNSYTAAGSHYILAIFFRIFSPSLEVMRSTLAALNISTLLIFSALLWRNGHRIAAIFFVWLWGLLPLSIHNHRFYIEMTSFLGFCLALNVLGGIRAIRLRKVDFFAGLLLYVPAFLALTSHIAYLSVLLAPLICLELPSFRQLFLPLRKPLAWLSFLSTLLLLKMGWGLQKSAPYFLSVILLLWSISLLASPEKIQSLLKRISFPMPHKNVLTLFSLLLSFVYIFLLWDGALPYSQVTGHLPSFWLPLNSLLLLWCLHRSLSDRSPSPLTQKILILTFLQFLTMSLLVYKQSPRYFMLTTLGVLLFVSLVLEQAILEFAIKAPAKRNGLILAMTSVFVWNFYAFEHFYLKEFNHQAGTDGSFRLLFFKDSGRDFRPFQKAVRWLHNSHCLSTLTWVEDDRFLRPLDFLKLAPTKALLSDPVTFAEPMPSVHAADAACPWTSEQMFFSHSPTPPGLKLLPVAQDKSWGDLGIFVRSLNLKEKPP